MIKKEDIDKNLIKELTKSVKDLTKAIEKIKSLNIQSEVSNPPMGLKKRVKIEHQDALKSPMVGTVYLSPEPGAKAFISQGQKIKAGDTLLIIEAMKTFNPIKARKSGKIEKILVNDAEPVEYGQPLIVIK